MLFVMSKSETTAFVDLSFGHIKIPFDMASAGLLGLYGSPCKSMSPSNRGFKPNMAEATAVFPLPNKPVIAMISFL